MLKEEGKKRLLEFCEFMDSISDEAVNGDHFNMDTFFSHNSDEHCHIKPGREKVATVKDLHTCGTQACAFGYLAASPIGKKLGIELHLKGAIEDNGWGDEEHVINDTFKLNGRMRNNIDISSKVFGLDKQQYEFLFGAVSELGSPADWAARCRMFLAVDGDVHHEWLENLPRA